MRILGRFGSRPPCILPGAKSTVCCCYFNPKVGNKKQLTPESLRKFVVVQCWDQTWFQRNIRKLFGETVCGRLRHSTFAEQVWMELARHDRNRKCLFHLVEWTGKHVVKHVETQFDLYSNLVRSFTRNCPCWKRSCNMIRNSKKKKYQKSWNQQKRRIIKHHFSLNIST